MPGRIEPLTETGIIAEMRAELARLRRGFTAAQSPIWEYQDWVLTGTPPTSTYTLTYLPYGINHVSLNGLSAREGTDYTMDYSTGILTFSATKTAGDVLSISYVTTGDLTAAAGPVDGGQPTFIAVNTATSAGFVTSVAVTIPAAAQTGDLLVLAASMRGTQTFDTPSGWTLGQSNSDGVQRVHGWYRICQASDPGTSVTVIITGAATEIPSVACLAYRSIAATSPLFTARHDGDPTSSTTWSAGLLDCSAATGISLGVLIWASFPAGSHPLTMPAGVIGRCDISSASNSRMLAVADELISAGAVEVTRTATPASAQPYVAIDMAFTAG